jgi:hypothetical protein
MADLTGAYSDILADHGNWLAGFPEYGAHWERCLKDQRDLPL